MVERAWYGDVVAGVCDPTAHLGLEGPIFRPRVSALFPFLVRFGPPSTEVLLRLLLLCLLFSGVAGAVFGQAPNVLTWRYDNTHQGQNTQETILTPTNVNTNTFGKLFSHTVDGQVYAQPLYVGSLTLANNTTHNVIFIADEH